MSTALPFGFLVEGQDVGQEFTAASIDCAIQGTERQDEAGSLAEQCLATGQRWYKNVKHSHWLRWAGLGSRERLGFEFLQGQPVDGTVSLESWHGPANAAELLQ